MFPLLHFTSSRKIMGRWANGWFLMVLAGQCDIDYPDGPL